MGKMVGNNLTKVKKQNEALIKEVIYKYGPISRIEIAEMLSLTPPTITSNISSMLEQKIVYECSRDMGDEEHGLGRRPVKLNFIDEAFYVVGVEINAYQLAICLVDLRGNKKSSLCSPLKEIDYHKELDILADQIIQVIAESGIDTNRILGIGIGITGFVEPKTGVVRSSFLRSWNNKNVARDLSRRLDFPVLVENNARARAVGAELFSKTLRPDTFAYYLISYGIACPLYIKNSVLDGEQKGSGEAGHMVAILNGPKCETCGNYGCLEEVASERAILKNIRAKIQQGRKTMLIEKGFHVEDITIKEILMVQECGDELAEEVIQETITYLGAMLANIINLVNPPLVLVDAYIMRLKKNRRQLLDNTRKHIFGLYEEEVEIEFVDFDQMIGARGAAALAIKKYFIQDIIV